MRGENGDSRGFALSVIGFLFIVAFVAFLYSPYFNITQVEILGAEAVTEEEILLAMGLVGPKNIFRLDVPRAEERVQEMPQVRSVEIARRLPGRVIVALEEREPIAIIPYAESFYTVDGAGVVLGPAHLLDLPVLNGGAPVGLALGEEVTSRSLQTGARVAALCTPVMRDAISEINVLDLEDIQLVTRNGLRVRLGPGVDLPLKVDVLESLLHRLPSGPASLDLRLPHTPVLEKRP
jgi:cell division protein FtsQ